MQKPVRSAPEGNSLRVLLVGDSEIVGARVHTALDRLPDIEVTAQVIDGIAAVSAIRVRVFDAIVLDIGHGESNLKVTITRLLKVDPYARIIMVASLSFANVKASMLGLMEGAAEFIPTPATHTKTKSETEFNTRLASVIRAFGRTERDLAGPAAAPATVIAPPKSKPPVIEKFALRPINRMKPDALIVGSSTGGPQALFAFLASLPPNIDIPILITQHMPAAFTALLASHISSHGAIDCREGVNGEEIVGGRAYIAPGAFHMRAVSVGGNSTIKISQEAPINYCRPSVDPMFESAAETYRGRVIGVILTGMGSDGLDGSQCVVDAGGMVIAQDEESCVVWGMPRAVSEAGICSAILPLDDLGPFVSGFLKSDW
jgi:two-component system chemotaxis response regulator CheB